MIRWGLLLSAVLAVGVIVVDGISGNYPSAVVVGLAAFSLGATLVYLFDGVTLLTGGAVSATERKALAHALMADRESAQRVVEGLELDVGLGRLVREDADAMIEPLQRRIEVLDGELEALDSGQLDAVDLAMRQEVRRRIEQEVSP